MNKMIAVLSVVIAIVTVVRASDAPVAASKEVKSALMSAISTSFDALIEEYEKVPEQERTDELFVCLGTAFSEEALLFLESMSPEEYWRQSSDEEVKVLFRGFCKKALPKAKAALAELRKEVDMEKALERYVTERQRGFAERYQKVVARAMPYRPKK